MYLNVKAYTAYFHCGPFVKNNMLPRISNIFEN